MALYKRNPDPRIKPPLGSILNPDHSLSRGIVSCWIMNEGGGDKIYDLSGNRNHGILKNGPTWTGGRSGSALSLDGANDYVALPNITIESAMTYTAWINTNDNTLVRQYILTLQVDPPSTATHTYMERHGFFLSNNDIIAQYWTGNSTVGQVQWDNVISNNTWYFITFVVDSSGGKLYVNGDLKDSSIDTPVLPTPNECIIGARNDADGTDPFDGIIDDVHVYNRALSSSEVVQLYSRPYCMFLQPQYWYMGIGPLYYFSGHVYDEITSNPVSRMIYCYRRDTAALIGSTTSSGDGYYYLETTYSGSHFLVALDNDSGTQYNLVGLDRMIPTTRSG